MKKIIINSNFNNKKLKNFINYNFPNFPNSMFFKKLRKKDIKINGKRINKDIILKTDDILELYINDDLLYGNKSIDVIYEDKNIIVINKPTGVCVNTSINNEPTLLDNIKNFLNLEVFALHRLDRNTSGLIIFAKNSESLNILENKFKNHEIKKNYYCTVIGIPKNKTATLCHYLEKDAKNNRVYIHDKPNNNTTKIITKYTIISTLPNNLSTLEVELITGKTHQIRAHLAYIGHPILGDGKYGINKINKEFGVKTQTLEAHKIIFDFKTDSGILNYLNGKIIEL